MTGGPEDPLVIEIKRGGVGMRQVVDEDMMRQDPNRNDQEIFLYGWLRRCFLLADEGRTELKQYDSQQLRAELEKRGEL